MGKKNRYKPTIDSARADALIVALQASESPEFDDGEGAAIAAKLAATQAVEALGHLFAIAPGKQTQKAVKRALYTLSQRGVSVPELTARPVAIKVASSAGGLPVLMAPPEHDAIRRFTFGRPADGGVTLIEVVLRANDGVFRLTSSPSQRDTYIRWAKAMCTSGERVRVDAQMCARKLWEVGRNVRDNRVGPEVERSLLDWLKPEKNAPPHPARALRLRGRVLDFGEFVSAPHRQAPFHHQSAIEKLREQWAEAGGSTIIQAADEVRAERARQTRSWIADLATQWGWVGLIELVLDLAVYCDAIGDPDGAATFRWIGDPEPPPMEEGPDAFAPPDPSTIREARILDLLFHTFDVAMRR